MAAFATRGIQIMRKAAAAISIGGLAAMSSHAADIGFTYLVPSKADARPAAPYSNGVMVGETLYVAGNIGIDAATGQAPANIDTETHLVMDAVKRTVEQAGLTMDDLVSVTVYCTDLELFDKFNSIYRTYFHGQFPARAFIGVNKLLRGGHFEVAAIAVKPPGTHKL
jgi:2-iminobutanoate/2-iminopropanoate deaminase